MIDRFQLIRNVGRFSSFTASADSGFSQLTLVYAENGRGKSTLAAILRSLSTGDPTLINERRRLGTPGAPHVVISINNGQSTAIFQNSGWSLQYPDIRVFDDIFVDQNVHSGLLVEAGHRQNLHELIIGRAGVALGRRVDQLTQEIAGLQATVREKETQITPQIRGSSSVEEFCALPHVPDIDAAIDAAQRRITALGQTNAVRSTTSFAAFALPPIEVGQLRALLSHGLEDLDAAALGVMRQHLTGLGPNGESWVSQGMGFLPPGEVEGGCPFCGQDLGPARLVQHYRAYFSQSYAAHKAEITRTRSTLSTQLSGDALARFQREVEAGRQLRQFWGQFLEVPEINLDSAHIARVWQDARDALLQLLDRKLASPLDDIEIDGESCAKLKLFSGIASSVVTVSRALQGLNDEIARLKTETEQGNLPAAQADLQRLRTTRSRHSPDADRLCQEYLAARQAKEAVERTKAAVREELDQHRQAVIPRYQSAINELLRRFSADFRIVEVQAVNPRGYPSSTYCIEINAHRIPVAGTEAPAGDPTFRSTLSSGDRNTLALAFFFAWLEQEPGLRSVVVVIDDPVSSLDDARSIATAQEIRGLVGRTRQTIVLSHSKALLCAIWQHADQSRCGTLEVRRSPGDSVITAWDVHSESITEYDRRHALLRDYDRGAVTDARQVAQSLRLVLEGFLRVACPEHVPPGTLLGNFIDQARQSQAGPRPIISSSDLQELEQVKEYANRFHHDSYPAWDIEVANINETQLHGFVRRVLAFTRRS